MTTPNEVWDYDMRNRSRVLRKRQEVPSGHDPKRYVTRRIEARRPHQGARHQQRLEDTPPTVGLDTIKEMLDELAPLTLAERKAVPGLPAARADVFPAALVTMLTVADFAHIDAFHHSLYNLRWGLAAETLASL